MNKNVSCIYMQVLNVNNIIEHNLLSDVNLIIITKLITMRFMSDARLLYIEL